jgi:hypothetical protein
LKSEHTNTSSKDSSNNYTSQNLSKSANSSTNQIPCFNLKQEFTNLNGNFSTLQEAFNLNAYRMQLQNQFMQLNNACNNSMYNNNQVPNINNLNQTIFSNMNCNAGHFNYPLGQNYLFNPNPVFPNCNNVPIMGNINNNSLLLNTIQMMKNMSQFQSLNNININNNLCNIGTQDQMTNNGVLSNLLMNFSGTPQ